MKKGRIFSDLGIFLYVYDQVGDVKLQKAAGLHLAHGTGAG
jgi:hypothetical protein